MVSFLQPTEEATKNRIMTGIKSKVVRRTVSTLLFTPLHDIKENNRFQKHGSAHGKKEEYGSCLKRKTALNPFFTGVKKGACIP